MTVPAHEAAFALVGFRGAMSHVGQVRAAGAVPLHRVRFIYACALSFGVPTLLALLLHGVVAVSASTAAVVPRLPGLSAASHLGEIVFVASPVLLLCFCAALATLRRGSAAASVLAVPRP